MPFYWSSARYLLVYCFQFLFFHSMGLHFSAVLDVYGLFKRSQIGPNIIYALLADLSAE